MGLVTIREITKHWPSGPILIQNGSIHRCVSDGALKISTTTLSNERTSDFAGPADEAEE